MGTKPGDQQGSRRASMLPLSCSSGGVAPQLEIPRDRTAVTSASDLVMHHCRTCSAGSALSLA